MVFGDWESRLTGQCPGSRLISQVVAVQRFSPALPSGFRLASPSAGQWRRRYRREALDGIPASVSPVPERVRQGPRGNVSPFSRSYKKQTTRHRAGTGERAYRPTHTHAARACSPGSHRSHVLNRAVPHAPLPHRSRQRRDITVQLYSLGLPLLLYSQHGRTCGTRTEL